MIEEISMMDAQLAHERSIVGDSFWSPIREVFTIMPIFRRMLLGTSLFIWQNGTGINAINYYSPTIFKSIGVTGTNNGLFTTGMSHLPFTYDQVFMVLLLDRYIRSD